jgi:hypothetical protein
MAKFDYGSSLSKLGNDDCVYVYVNIPKNASCFVKMLWSGAAEVNFKRDIFPIDTVFVVVLRDPIRRWISGFAQEKHTEVRSPNDLDWNKVFDNPVATDHTEPQITFIKGLDLSRVIWFKFEDDLYGNLQHFLKDKWKIRNSNDIEVMRTRGTFNVSADDINKSNLISNAKVRLKLNNVYQEKLNKVYKDDLNLYNSVKYYSKES